jgi:hypothetical protein
MQTVISIALLQIKLHAHSLYVADSPPIDAGCRIIPYTLMLESLKPVTCTSGSPVASKDWNDDSAGRLFALYFKAHQVIPFKH